MTPPRVPVSIVVPVRDEAARIEGFLAAHPWADEVIVVDNGSRDATAALARAAGARVIERPDDTIGEARNAGADAARNEWILALDADERADPALEAELRTALRDPAARAFSLVVRNWYLGREQRRGSLRPGRAVRCYHRSLRFSTRAVHEALQVGDAIAELRTPIRHEPYRDVAHHLEKLDRYARWGAAALHAQGRRSHAIDRTLRPAWRFVRSYLLWGGFLDGRLGWQLSAREAEGVCRKYRYLRELSANNRS